MEATQFRDLLNSQLPDSYSIPSIDTRWGAFETRFTQPFLSDLAFGSSAIRTTLRSILHLKGDIANLEAGMQIEVFLKPRIEGRGDLALDISIEELKVANLEQAQVKGLSMSKLVVNTILRLVRSPISKGLQEALANSIAPENISRIAVELLSRYLPAFLTISKVKTHVDRLLLENDVAVLELGLAINQGMTKNGRVALSLTEVNQLLAANLDTLNSLIAKDELQLSMARASVEGAELVLNLEFEGVGRIALAVHLDLHLDADRQLLTAQQIDIQAPSENSWIASIGIRLGQGVIKRQIESLFPLDLKSILTRWESEFPIALPFFKAELSESQVHELKLTTETIALTGMGLIEVRALRPEAENLSSLA